MFIKSNVELEFVTKCEGILSIINAKLSDKPISEDVEEYEEITETEEENEEMENKSSMFEDALLEFNVRFSYQDGVITEICPPEEEKNWVLNFKRGLLSMMHNTMERLDLDHESVEEDVRGKCKTNYKMIGSKETSLIIEKTKDLSSCTSRSKLHSVIQSTPYNYRPVSISFQLHSYIINLEQKRDF